MPLYPAGHSYASSTDLEEAGLPAGTLAGLSAGTVNRALERASRVADTYVRAQATLPLSEPYDQGLVDAVCQIASWRLMQRRGFNPHDGGDTAIRVGYEDAIAFLVRIANGQAKLDIVQAVPEHAEPMVSGGTPRGYSGDSTVTYPWVGPNGMGF